MGFLKQFFVNVFDDQLIAKPASGFGHLSQSELEAHLSVARYGDFELSDAVRPSFALEVVPSAGFRHDVYRDEETRSTVPVLMAAVSKPRMMETFVELLHPLGEVVDVVLETSHSQKSRGHTDLYREHIETPILQSILWDFEDLLVNDGCTGIAVLNPNIPQEVQLDEHKLLLVYGAKLTAYESILIDCHLNCREDMKFITEAEHVHSTTEQYIHQFEELKIRLGMDEYR
jgi:hypothetical protein